MAAAKLIVYILTPVASTLKHILFPGAALCEGLQWIVIFETLSGLPPINATTSRDRSSTSSSASVSLLVLLRCLLLRPVLLLFMVLVLVIVLLVLLPLVAFSYRLIL